MIVVLLCATTGGFCLQLSVCCSQSLWLRDFANVKSDAALYFFRGMKDDLISDERGVISLFIMLESMIALCEQMMVAVY